MGKKTGRRKQHNDLVLTFDPEKRKEFLSGFRKRKLERKAKAREELDKQIKAEKARINQEKKDELKQKNELLEKYVEQFTAPTEDTEEVIETDEQTITIKKVALNEEAINYDALEEESRAKLLDGIKAQQVKKNDIKVKKLKKLTAKQQSLESKNVPKHKRQQQGNKKGNPKANPKTKGGKVQKRKK